MLLLFLAMFVLIEHNAMAVQNINPICAALCVVKCNTKPICLTLCLAKCSITKITYEESVDTEPTNHVCNVGCSLGHCFKFLVNYGTTYSLYFFFLRTDMQKSYNLND